MRVVVSLDRRSVIVGLLALHGATARTQACAAPSGRARPLRSAVRAEALSPERQNRAHRYLTAVEAARYLARHRDLVLVDVRPAGEVTATGTPRTAIANIPYVTTIPPPPDAPLETLPKIVVNPEFLAAIAALPARGRARVDTHTGILLICSAGYYSARAADLLASAGYLHTYSIVDGTDGATEPLLRLPLPGWRKAGLPWKAAPSR